MCGFVLQNALEPRRYCPDVQRLRRPPGPVWPGWSTTAPGHSHLHRHMEIASRGGRASRATRPAPSRQHGGRSQRALEPELRPRTGACRHASGCSRRACCSSPEAGARRENAPATRTAARRATYRKPRRGGHHPTRDRGPRNASARLRRRANTGARQANLASLISRAATSQAAIVCATSLSS